MRRLANRDYADGAVRTTIDRGSERHTRANSQRFVVSKVPMGQENVVRQHVAKHRNSPVSLGWNFQDELSSQPGNFGRGILARILLPGIRSSRGDINPGAP